MAADLRAYLAPRRVRYYPTRGTGYASQISPPPHLVGLRVDALDALSAETDPVVVASAVALAETVPDASLRPAGFSVSRGEEIDLGRTRGRPRRCRLRAGRAGHRARPVRGPWRDSRRLSGDRGAGGADRALRGRNRLDALVLDLHPALAGEAERIEFAPAAELDAEHRGIAELALADDLVPARAGAKPSLPGALPLEHFRAPLELVAEGAAVILSPADEIEPALRDHWEDATTAMHADDARHLYVDVAAPLAAPRGALDHLRRRSGFRGVPRLEGGVAGAQHEGGRGRAGEAARLRLPDHRRLRRARRSGARPLQPRPARRRDPRRPPALPGPRPGLRRGAPQGGLRLAGAAAGRLSVQAPRPPPPARRGTAAGSGARPPRLHRAAGR